MEDQNLFNIDQALLEKVYSHFDEMLHHFRFMARMSHKYIYLADFNRNKAYLFRTPPFIPGPPEQELPIDEVYNFYFGLNDEERVRTNNAVISGMKILNGFPIEQRQHCTVITYWNVHVWETVMEWSHRGYPYLFTPDGKLWLGFGLLDIAPKGAGKNNPIILNETTRETWIYKKEKWQPLESIFLTEREKTILALSAQGYNSQEIGNLLCKSLDSIKTTKRNLFNKMKVSAISEALSLDKEFHGYIPFAVKE